MIQFRPNQFGKGVTTLCGIFGFIGRSKNPKVTYELLHNLFLKTEVRGTDATGFYATHPGDSSIIFDKEPVKSSEYIKKEVWTKVFEKNSDVDLFIGHCRQTSVGGGPERVNKNNHPHWSHDRRVAITHNGKIPEFTALKSRYDIESECDSEILLRMFESAQIIAKDKEEELKKEFPTLTPFLAERLTGLKEIFSRVNYGAMAVAIAERGDDNQRYLWLFRDDDRPLHVVDMRETLGQIFYCSTAEIWRNALDATPILKKENNKEGVDYIPSDQVIIEFPSYQIWLLNLDPSKEAVANDEGVIQDNSWNIRKFKITKTKYIDWKESEEDDDKLSFKLSKEMKRPLLEKIITRLGDNDIVKSDEKEKVLVPLGVSADDLDDKKKIKGGNPTGFRSGGRVEAKVNVGNDPGDESDTYETPTGYVEPILKSSELVTEGVLDLTTFNDDISDLIKKLEKIKEETNGKATANALPNRNFSIILDNLETMRQEATKTLELLKS